MSEQSTLFDITGAQVVDVERLARALFIHVCPMEHIRPEAWDSGKAPRATWIEYAHSIIRAMGWQT